MLQRGHNVKVDKNTLHISGQNYKKKLTNSNLCIHKQWVENEKKFMCVFGEHEEWKGEEKKYELD